MICRVLQCALGRCDAPPQRRLNFPVHPLHSFLLSPEPLSMALRFGDHFWVRSPSATLSRRQCLQDCQLIMT